MSGHMKYTQPSEFTLLNSRVLVYKDFHSYVTCPEGRDMRAKRIVKLPSPRGAFIVYGDNGNVYAEALGGVFFMYNSYYAAPVFILVGEQE